MRKEMITLHLHLRSSDKEISMLFGMVRKDYLEVSATVLLSFQHIQHGEVSSEKG